MKTATRTSFRIEPEAVLADGQKPSTFVELSAHPAIKYRKVQVDLRVRGQASREHFERTGVSYPLNEVLDALRHVTVARRTEFAAKSK